MFDTVYVSLYKNFNTLSGAILAGPVEIIDQLRHWRRRNGGGLAQWWPVAAVALHYYDGLAERLGSAADDAEEFYVRLKNSDKFSVQEVPNGSSVRYLSCPDGDLTFLNNLRARLIQQGIDLPQPDDNRLHFALKTNESWLRSDPQTLASKFLDAANDT
jgi:threonine aldolase